MNSQQNISLFSKKAELGKLHEFLYQYINTHELPDRLLHDLNLALEETFINIVNYAHNDTNTEKHTISIGICHANNSISILFSDTGVAFNPLKDVSLSNKSADYSNGGMGIALIKSLTDEQYYVRTNQTNVFTLIKYYTQ